MLHSFTLSCGFSNINWISEPCLNIHAHICGSRSRLWKIKIEFDCKKTNFQASTIRSLCKCNDVPCWILVNTTLNQQRGNNTFLLGKIKQESKPKSCKGFGLQRKQTRVHFHHLLYFCPQQKHYWKRKPVCSWRTRIKMKNAFSFELLSCGRATTSHGVHSLYFFYKLKPFYIWSSQTNQWKHLWKAQLNVLSIKVFSSFAI